MKNDRSQSGLIAIPGDLLDDSGDYRAGEGTYARAGSIYAKRMGLKSLRQDEVAIVSLGGCYDPKPGDLVIAIITENGTSNWMVDVAGPYPAPLHVNEVPWKVGFAETGKFLEHGDAILCKILFVDESKKVQVTMNDRNLRKLQGGSLLEVAPSRVPRVIGRSGSMINLIKKYTDVWLFVGQNGRIWLNGEQKDIDVATMAIRKIEREAHIPGLTDRVKAFLQEKTGRTVNDDEEEE